MCVEIYERGGCTADKEFAAPTPIPQSGVLPWLLACEKKVRGNLLTMKGVGPSEILNSGLVGRLCVKGVARTEATFKSLCLKQGFAYWT